MKISKVVIVGGGTAGWMAAASLGQFFGDLLDVVLVESDEIGTVGVGEATIPQIRLLLGQLQIDEAEFLRAVNGTIKLGIQFNGWRREGHRYMHAFGELGRPLGNLPFHHYWLKSQPAGGDLWDYSTNFQAAKANRFGMVQASDKTGATPLVYAYHFDATRVAAFLRSHAGSRGVNRIEGKVVDVRRDSASGHIRSVVLEGERVVEGDLFIDCSGFRGLLIGQAMESDHVDWSHWLACDSALAVQCETSEPLKPYTESSARPAGWQWRIPLQNRTGNGHVFCSRLMEPDQARALLLDTLDGPAIGEPRLLRFQTGHRREFWKGNCVSLGLAAGFMEPLESTSIHLVQTGLDRLIRMFPGNGLDGAAIAEFNRQTVFEYERIRDFLVLHYHLNERLGEPFWDECREMELPDSLAHRLELFREAGLLFKDGEELFHEVGWLQLLVGQGVQPGSYHPLADRVNDEQLQRWLANLRTVVNGSVAQLPGHRDFVAQHFAVRGGP